MSWFWGVLAVGGPQGSWQRVPGSGSQGWGGEVAPQQELTWTVSYPRMPVMLPVP